MPETETTDNADKPRESDSSSVLRLAVIVAAVIVGAWLFWPLLVGLIVGLLGLVFGIFAGVIGLAAAIFAVVLGLLYALLSIVFVFVPFILAGALVALIALGIIKALRGASN